MKNSLTKKILGLIVFVACIGMAGTAKAQDNPFGIGASIGDHTGLNYKYWFSNDYALNGSVTGVIRDGSSRLYAHWDFLIHRHDLIEVDEGRIPFYYGFGFFTSINQNFDNDAGLRIPIGIEYLLEGDRLGVYLETAPTIQITGNESLTFQGSIGFRYYL